MNASNDEFEKWWATFNDFPDTIASAEGVDHVARAAWEAALDAVVESGLVAPSDAGILKYNLSVKETE